MPTVVTMPGTTSRASSAINSTSGPAAGSGVGSEVAPASSTTTFLSRTTFRVWRSTSATESPGRIRKFTNASARCGSTFGFTPPRIMVGAVVVRTSASVCGRSARMRAMAGPATPVQPSRVRRGSDMASRNRVTMSRVTGVNRSGNG